jgi:transcriptional regulator with GAF, ATPase, and Fis domain
LLAQFFAHRVCEKNNIKDKLIDDDSAELKRYDWSGNVLQLHVMERMIPLREFRDKSERDFILATLRRNLGNISQSASGLGNMGRGLSAEHLLRSSQTATARSRQPSSIPGDRAPRSPRGSLEEFGQ